MIKLDQLLALRCWKFAADLCWHYAQGGSANSRAVSYRGAEANVPLQTQAKMAECIFCRELDADPYRLLNWGLQADAGADLTLDGYRFDIKASAPNAKFLLWPKAKNHIFATKRFDALVLVRVDLQTASGASVAFILKDDFERRKLVAEAGHRLDPGTWHIGIDDLCSTDALIACYRRREVAA